LTPEGAPALQIGDGKGKALLCGNRPLRERRWNLVVAGFDAEAGKMSLATHLRDPNAIDVGTDWVSLDTMMRPGADASTPFIMAATQLKPADGPQTLGYFFNGRLDRPAVYGRALSSSEVDQLATGLEPANLPGVLASWDFGQAIDSARAVEVSGAGLEGRVVNVPLRGVKGHNWTGRYVNFADAPQEYGAIHFHDDDLEDAGWEVGHHLPIPAEWPSGVYAIRLRTDEFEDYVPFIVRPARGRATAQIALLVPTLTYLAYGNDHMPTSPGRLLDGLGITMDEFLDQMATEYEADVFRYMVEHRLHSLYEFHSDGDPVAHATRLRPMPNLRPRYNKPNIRFRYPHLLSCDLYIVDWLEQKGFAYDTIDDESLHAEGVSLLAPYKVIMTGTHPEYWSHAMLTALRRYQAQGGRVMYLGGNGFYWVTSFDRERPHIVEIRRGFAGLRTWTSAPGECFHSTTGEFGGLWRFRGIPPQSVVGIGFGSACGLEPARPYRRTRASYDPAVAFIFEGVEGEVFGDAGLHMEGAAGWELDIVDRDLGTPPQTVVLAQSFGHTDAYQRAIEDLGEVDASQGGTKSPYVRADLTYCPGPNGGATFSVGSISWCGSLSHNDYNNGVSRITENVLRAFSK
jgi:N,N-dimethylformamidase